MLYLMNLKFCLFVCFLEAFTKTKLKNVLSTLSVPRLNNYSKDVRVSINHRLGPKVETGNKQDEIRPSDRAENRKNGT